MNAFCWPRDLPGDFAEVAKALGTGAGITTVEEATAAGAPVEQAGAVAREVLLADQELLRAHELDPVLDCIRGSAARKTPAVVRTDVHSFHVDSAPVPAETWLCSYLGASTEGLRNEEARRRMDLPETRARLLQLFGGEDGEAFREFLAEHGYDLHYAPAPGAEPFAFGLGNLWRIAVEYPGSPVPPCIHRAPETLPGDPARLLLIS